MKYSPTHIDGVWLIEPQKFGDERGYFMESFKLDEFRAATGTDIQFVQDNESQSSLGVLRGLHFQRGSFSQAKLVRVSLGRVLDVAVDLRSGSPTFGKYIAVELSQENGRQMFIPRHFAHGFVVLSPTAQFQYKVDNLYAPKAEATLNFNDPDLAIEWPKLPSGYILSAKDSHNALTLAQAAAIVETDPE